MRLLHFRLVAGLALLGLGLAYGWCSRGAEVRMRVSYKIDDNGIIRSGSGVWSKRIWAAVIPLTEKYNSEFRGEAIPIMLPGRGVLLLMPMGDQGSSGDVGTLLRHRFDTSNGQNLVSNFTAIARMIGKSKTIPCGLYAIPQTPMEPNEIPVDHCLRFAFISDPNNASTFRRMTVVDGRFPDVKGLKLRDARITITSEPVSRGLEKLLPWIPTMQKYWMNHVITDDDNAKHAFEMIFIRN